MKIVVTIEDTPDKTVLVTVEGETSQETRAKRIADLIIPAVRGHFQPRQRRVRRLLEFAE